MEGYYLNNLWYYGVSKEGAYSNYPGEGHMVHKGFDVDERVWFEKDDVAKGEDTIVKRALQWIANLTYGHDVTLAKSSGKPGVDTIKVTTTVENPQKHSVAVWANLSDRSGSLVDSCQMLDDGLHNDGIAGDKLYGGVIRPPTKESAFGVSVRTTDSTAGTFRHLPNVRRFFTNGPIICGGYTFTSVDTIPNPGDVLRLKYLLANSGKSDTVRSVTALASALDTMSYIPTTLLSFGDLPPGGGKLCDANPGLKIQSWCPPGTKVRLLLNISSEGIPLWTDTVSIMVEPSTGIANENSWPTEYSLAQNYPNPFNPATVISYQLPVNRLVTLKVYDMLGRELATLVNEKKDAGRYSAQWDATRFSSGVYFYTLQAGEYHNTKRMLLLR
jgi:hypothetical protein